MRSLSYNLLILKICPAHICVLGRRVIFTFSVNCGAKGSSANMWNLILLRLNRRADLTMVRVSSRRFPQATTARCMTSSARACLGMGRATLLNTQKKNRCENCLQLGTEGAHEWSWTQVHQQSIFSMHVLVHEHVGGSQTLFPSLIACKLACVLMCNLQQMDYS